jgi:hypothetical protein
MRTQKRTIKTEVDMTLEISETAMQILRAEAERRDTNPESLVENLIHHHLLIRKRDLSHLAGTWSDEEVREFEESVASLQQVVEEDSA